MTHYRDEMTRDAVTGAGLCAAVAAALFVASLVVGFGLHIGWNLG